MGMSSHVVAIRPPDERWRQMRAVWDACTAAGIDPPSEVEEFFDGERPDSEGVVIDLRHPRSDAVREWRNDHSEGYEVLLDQLPPDVKILRFYNSW